MAVFAIHVALLMFRQYEYAYVFNNTRNQMPEIYRFSAAWAAQEGSFLLWALTSSVFAAWVARATGVYRRWFTVICAVVLAAILGIIAYESPFRHTPLAPDLLATLPQGQTTVLPPDGRGLNPLLQNYWMAIHPWVIFIGFG
ncbi:MAG: cytochrome c biogenesis protein CcsA, partial [Candidatus Nitrosotenuis sp.]